MKVYDFIYDKNSLSDIGYMICSIGSNNEEIVSNCSQINFNTVPVQYGKQNYLINSSYNECVTATFYICKKTCNGNKSMGISLREFNDLAEWLNRRSFHTLKFHTKDYGYICFEASFNLSKYEVNGEIYAIQLNMITNRPHAFKELTTIKEYNISADSYVIIPDDYTNEEGFIYPKIKVILHGDGKLQITNLLENSKVTEISNCVNGEIITFEYPLISTSISSHKIQNDFNWIFPRMIKKFYGFNSFTNNAFKVSLDCDLEISYYPIIKFGL